MKTTNSLMGQSNKEAENTQQPPSSDFQSPYSIEAIGSSSRGILAGPSSSSVENRPLSTVTMLQKEDLNKLIERIDNYIERLSLSEDFVSLKRFTLLQQLMSKLAAELSPHPKMYEGFIALAFNTTILVCLDIMARISFISVVSAEIFRIRVQNQQEQGEEPSTEISASDIRVAYVLAVGVIGIAIGLELFTLALFTYVLPNSIVSFMKNLFHSIMFYIDPNKKIYAEQQIEFREIEALCNTYMDIGPMEESLPTQKSVAFFKLQSLQQQHAAFLDRESSATKNILAAREQKLARLSELRQSIQDAIAEFDAAQLNSNADSLDQPLNTAAELTTATRLRERYTFLEEEVMQIERDVVALLQLPAETFANNHDEREIAETVPLVAEEEQAVISTAGSDLDVPSVGNNDVTIVIEDVASISPRSSPRQALWIETSGSTHHHNSSTEDNTVEMCDSPSLISNRYVHFRLYWNAIPL